METTHAATFAALPKMVALLDEYENSMTDAEREALARKKRTATARRNTKRSMRKLGYW